MLVLLSPAKSLNFEDTRIEATTPDFLKDTHQIINTLKKFSKKKIKDLMGISDQLTQLNYQRYQDFSKEAPFLSAGAAMEVFDGGVYQGLDARTLDAEAWDYAQKHVRILSGLYGILKPKDLIQPYRLEMGTSLAIGRKAKNLYDFWKEKLTTQMNADIEAAQIETVVNLASNEYSKAIDFKGLKAKVLEIKFKEYRDGKLKFISFNAKKARGLMTRYIIDNKIYKIEDIKGFNYEDYYFEKELSKANEWVFVR